jgi:hypothetical protein
MRSAYPAGTATEPCASYGHTRLTRVAEAGVQLPTLMVKSRHTSLTSESGTNWPGHPFAVGVGDYPIGAVGTLRRRAPIYRTVTGGFPGRNASTPALWRRQGAHSARKELSR